VSWLPSYPERKNIRSRAGPMMDGAQRAIISLAARVCASKT
jgi:hypothetical protein